MREWAIIQWRRAGSLELLSHVSQLFDLWWWIDCCDSVLSLLCQLFDTNCSRSRMSNLFTMLHRLSLPINRWRSLLNESLLNECLPHGKPLFTGRGVTSSRWLIYDDHAWSLSLSFARIRDKARFRANNSVPNAIVFQLINDAVESSGRQFCIRNVNISI